MFLDLPPLPLYLYLLSAPGYELSPYLDSGNVTAYEEDFELLLSWRDHKLTFLILSIMARDILSISVSTVSS